VFAKPFSTWIFSCKLVEVHVFTFIFHQMQLVNESVECQKGWLKMRCLSSMAAQFLIFLAAKSGGG